ncbi:MAG: hypothetical protein PHI11_15465 [Gallionella sp.]|nr:hypothetical protein [Gallionella sp.]
MGFYNKDTEFTVADSEAAAEILHYLGFSVEVSLEPFVDRRRDHVARIIRAAFEVAAVSATSALGVQTPPSKPKEKRVNLNDKKHTEAVQKVQIAVASLQAADQNPSYREVNRWLKDHGYSIVNYRVWKKIGWELSRLGSTNNNNIESMDELMASLYSN